MRRVAPGDSGLSRVFVSERKEIEHLYRTRQYEVVVRSRQHIRRPRFEPGNLIRYAVGL